MLKSSETIQGWIEALEQDLARDAQAGKARPLSLHGYSYTTRRQINLPDYTAGLPRPLALRGAMDLMAQEKMEYVAESACNWVCEMSRCKSTNTLIVVGPATLYLSGMQPVYGLGGIADVFKFTPDKIMAQSFLERAKTASGIAASEALGILGQLRTKNEL